MGSTVLGSNANTFGASNSSFTGDLSVAKVSTLGSTVLGSNANTFGASNSSFVGDLSVAKVSTLGSTVLGSNANTFGASNSSFVGDLSVAKVSTLGSTVLGSNANTFGASNSSFVGDLSVAGVSIMGSTVLGSNANTFGASNSSFTGDVIMKNSAFVAGWVGIGTDLPSYPLHVASGTDGISIFCAGDMATFSDRREKSNIVRIPNALEKLMAIGGYTYTMGGGRHAGVVAQEVAEQLPEAVHEDPVTGRLAVSHGNLLALVVEAVRELAVRQPCWCGQACDGTTTDELIEIPQ
jgi:hypothetical protein